ncbi:MAG: ribonuclease E/G [Roseburia sp.]|nr:ribonuclease E/G [Roseburia sp.]
MKKYIITQENLKTVRGEQNFIVSALYDENRKMIEASLSSPDEEGILGNLYIGRVENVVKNLNAAFIRISPEQICYYSMDEYKHPLFTKKISEKKPLVEGEELVVQVSREALKTKEPAVTTNLNFTGKYAVLTTENQSIGVSSKLAKTDRERLKLLAENIEHPDFGLILRTNAKDASDEEILAEIAALAKEWQTLKETAQHKTCYTCLKKEPPTYIKEIVNLPTSSVDELITDDRALFEQLCGIYGVTEANLWTKGSVSVPVNEVKVTETLTLRYYNDPLLRLSSLYSIKSSLEDALAEKVWLKSGAYLIIQPTEALTVIDVNTGKNVAKKDVQENFLKINKEAAIEIARQLRLRNISGIIVIDFMNLTSKEAEDDLVSTFRAELKKDPVPTQLIDMTKLGLVEVTRKKVRKSLGEVLKGI